MSLTLEATDDRKRVLRHYHQDTRHDLRPGLRGGGSTDNSRPPTFGQMRLIK
jgi:hypothetical protein